MLTKAPEGDSAVPGRPGATRGLVIAAWASIGAGAIHATAAGNHSEHRQAVLAFVAVATFQIAWGVLALVRYTPILGGVGVVGQVAAIGGWVLAKVEGIGFVEGLEGSERVQFADGLAAGLALVAVGGVVAPARGWTRGSGSPLALATRVPRAVLTGTMALAGVALVIPGMVAAGSHSHDGGDHGAAGAEHGHSDSTATDAHGTDMAAGHGEAAGHGDAAGEHAAGETHPFDPTQPIDLSGMPGVTPEQQAQAENLLAISLIRLPQFADVAATQARGYHSVGDSITGYEHFVNWTLVDDDKVLDPDHPESLVYRVDGPERELVAAMFMLPTGTTLGDVPDLGGGLLQWHVHDNLCFSADPVAPQVASVIPADSECPAPTRRIQGGPMVHVWIEPHRCGPFAALEGIAGGQVAEGEERLCDHAHGSSLGTG
ncbi:MAG: hypothetical protein ACRD2C_17940 [Acidimicrobiales bacterium]